MINKNGGYKEMLTGRKIKGKIGYGFVSASKGGLVRNVRAAGTRSTVFARKRRR